MAKEQESRFQTLVAQLAVLLVILFIIVGALLYGLSGEVHQRIWKDMAGRPGGPMTFRFFLQPTMSFIAALIDGINDARLGRSPYFWALIHNRDMRKERLREALVSTARIILLGLCMDAIYQYRFLHTFYPGEAVLISLALALIPYFILRGPISRIARRFVTEEPSR